MNEFKKDLEWSLDVGTCETLNSLYKKMFLDLVEIVTVKDLQLQKRGIDKMIILENGKQLLIDEKIRCTDYGDILIEEYSDFDRKKVGWIGRDKCTDYIVYYIVPSQKVYLLPFILLQQAWIKNYKTWLEKYHRKMADNGTYKTSNIPVPVKILLEAISNEMCKQDA